MRSSVDASSVLRAAGLGPRLFFRSSSGRAWRFIALCVGFTTLAMLPASCQVLSTPPGIGSLSVAKSEGIGPSFVSAASLAFHVDTARLRSDNTVDLTSCMGVKWTTPAGDVVVPLDNIYAASNPVDTQTGLTYVNHPLSDPTRRVMTAAGATTIGYPPNTAPDVNVQGLDLKYPPPYVLGVTLFKISTTDGGAIPSDCTVTISSQDFPGDDVVFHVPPGRSTAVFGQGVYVPADSPYPIGIAGGQYYFVVRGTGYSQAGSAYLLGSLLPGSTFGVALAPNGTRSPPVQQSTTTAADNPDTPPASGGSGDLTAATDFFTNFWAKLKQFIHDQFVPTPDSLTALRSALASLTSYGPFGLPGQISGLFGTLSTQVDSTSHQQDGTYWYWYLRAPDLGVSARPGFVFGNPLGYDPTLEPVQQHNPTIYDSILPVYLDLTPFSDVLLFTRRFMLLAGWLYFVTEMLSLLIPKPGV